MHSFDTILQSIKIYEPAILLDRVFPFSIRRTVERTTGLVVVGLTVVVISHVLLTQFGLAEESAFIANLRNASEQIYGLYAIILSLYLPSLLVNAFYFSHYFKSCPSCILPEMVIGGIAHPSVSFEAADILYGANPSDLSAAFLSSSYGHSAVARVGIDPDEIVTFLKGKRAPVPAAICTFRGTGEFDMLMLEDVGRAIVEKDTDFVYFLASRGTSKEAFLGALAWVARSERRYKRGLRYWAREKLGRIPSIGKDWSYGAAFRLQRYASELTGGGGGASGAAGSLVRPDVEKLEQVLVRGRETNALIVGDDGGVKLQIVYELARLIGSGQAFPEIEGKRVFLFDGSAFLASQQGKKAFEIEFSKMLADAADAGDVILVIKDLPHLIEGARAVLADALALLEPYLAGSALQIIALATSGAYHHLLEHDETVKRYFERMLVKEKSSTLYIELIEDEAEHAEWREGLFFTYPAIVAIVESAERYFPDGEMPDTAIDLLFDVATSLKKRDRRSVLRDDVLAIVKGKTGIPTGVVSAEEKDMLLNLEEKLHARVVGQDQAIKAIAGALRRARSGIGNPHRPVGSFLFLGPTGVGKTETVKALAETFFGSSASIIRLDMSEYKTADALDRLIGSYAGGKPGILTSKIREQPYGVLLLDEFEKTSEEVLDLFLPILDEGVFTDMDGKNVHVEQMIIIATSNAGSDIIWNALGENSDGALDQQKLIQTIIERRIFKPELLNRFDGVIVFHPLQEGHLKNVGRLMLEKLATRLKERGIELVITDELVEVLVKAGSDPAFGARPMNRVIQEKVEQVIAEKMLRGEISGGSSVTLTAKDFEK